MGLLHMSTLISAEPFDDTDVAAPLWRDAVVGASVAAMAAAAGLGTHYEVGAAPWLSITAAGLTAVALWGAHRQFGQQRVIDTPAPPKRKVKRPAPAEAPATAETADKMDKQELSTFTPRGALPVLPGHIAAPILAAAAATQRPVNAAPIERPIPPALPQVSIDPEAQFLHLQGLVRQLATDVPGARPATPDPDAARAVTPQVGGAIPAPSSKAAPATAASPLANRLAEAVAAERMDVLLEPIQLLAEAKTRHFEVSVRFRDHDGEVLAPDDVSQVARATGLSTSIDALKLPRVAKVVQRIMSRGGSPSDVLTALAGASLADHHFMEAFAGAFQDGVPEPLVLSFPQADVRAFARVHWSALSALGDMGVRFALNDVSDLDMDFELLRARSFLFAKLDAAVFLNGLPCGGTVIRCYRRPHRHRRRTWQDCSPWRALRAGPTVRRRASGQIGYSEVSRLRSV
jgi:EAL domain-containing protein (putative c-di-GMP-specific phosphodiesterase class I)